MKQKFYSLFLTVALGMLGMNTWAQDYEISNAQEFIDFAEAVNGGETTANAVLTDDIDLNGIEWTPIGNATNVYTGTFDGGGFTISGLNLTTASANAGLFGYIKTDAVIKNFIVEGDISTAHQFVGGAVGRADGGTVSNIHSKVNISATVSRVGGVVGGQWATGTVNIDHCTYSGTLDFNNTDGNYGGFIGVTYNNASAYVNITNCLFDGEIMNATGGAGGFVGYTRGCRLTIKSCLSNGTISAGSPGQFIGQMNTTSRQKYEGVNYYVTGDKTQGTGSATEAGPAPIKITEEQLASGEICYLLNESVSGGTNWFQALGDDDYPFPYNGGTHDPVYANGSYNCDGVTPKGPISYGNTESSIVDPHTLGEGICSVCGKIMNEDYIIPNADGDFEIGTPAQLRWFAAYVNQVNPEVDAILTADIDLSSIAWVPIGNANAKYTGIFDGQSHAITNFTYIATSDHNGLFGYIDGEAAIKNFSISGELTSDGFTYNGLVGQAEGNSKVSGIYSNMDINVSNFKAHSGGIVGGCSTASKILVENCEYAGTLTHSGAGDCQAGILGYTYQGGVKNCIFSGTIIGQNNKYGGILGYCKAPAFQGIQNCLSIGKIVADEGCTTAAAIIANWNGDVTENVKNNYYKLQDGSTTTIAIGNKASNCEAPVEVDATQLASGEVAYKLGTAFRQNLGTDATPVLDANHAVVGYISAAGYATQYIVDTDVTIPAGVEAFAGELESTWLKLNAIEGKIAAGEPVVLKGNAGYYSFVPTTGATKAAKNDLKGTAEDIEAAGKFVLAKPEGEQIGFYKATTGSIKAGKAYFEVASDVKGFIFTFDDDDATSINEELRMKNEESEAAIYNLAGQRMSKMQKGLNVVNGKKTLF